MSENNRDDALLPFDSIEQAPPAEQSALLQEPARGGGPAPTGAKDSIRTLFIAAVGWIVPGFGHLLQGRIGRALIAFLTVGTMSFVGLRMRGNVFPPHGDDIFGVLGFLADAGSGIFYFLAHTIEKAGPDVSRAAGDYGTRLIATAGVLNLLFVLDATEISRGRKI
jgi:hypothetical protein